MNERVTIRLSKKTFHSLKDEAAKLGLSVAVLARRWLEKILMDPAKNFFGDGLEKPSECKKGEEFDFLRPLVQENNLLLRKIARYTNSQIVIETDEQMEHLLKKGKT